MRYYMQNSNRKKSRKLVVAFLVASCLLITGGLLATQAKISEAATKPEEVIWQCSASGANRYVVDQLMKEDGANFDLAIYKIDSSHPSDLYPFGSGPEDYLETATLTPNLDKNGVFTATGRSSKGMIVVEAFGRTKAFTVKDGAVEATAFGQCDRFWQMASSQARRKIRECLAAVARNRGGSIAEVEIYRCMFSDR
jgi:hypothetical protein